MQKNVLEYLENTVIGFPDKIAFTDGKKGLSFKEIYSRARVVGSALKPYSGALIIVSMEKSPEMISAFFGVAYSGSVYVPLDSAMYTKHISSIIAKLSPAAAVCDAKSADRLREVGYNGDIHLYEELITAEEDAAFLDMARQKQIDTDLLYIVFTSGSTGEPKGVAASHRSVISYIDNLADILGVAEDTVFGNQVPLYLDACLKEVYCTVKRGACTYLIPKTLFMFPVRLIEYLNEHRINTVCWVSSALSLISGLGALEAAKPEHFRTVAFGSEIFPVKQVLAWLDALPDARFINLYGPTEATGMSCFYEVDRRYPIVDSVPIGRAFPNVDVFLISDGQRVTEPETQGLIHIRGAGIAPGYYNDSERGREVFVQNPLQSNYREYVYNTGDIGKYNVRGELVYVCRNDSQIKRHGYRIEIMEVELAAGEIEGVAAAICVYSARFDNISLYYCGQPDEKALAGLLKKALPYYMLPNRFIKLEAMPKLDNHKIDRALLLKDLEESLDG